MIRTLALAAGLAITASAAQAAFTGAVFVEGDSAAATTAIGSAATVIQIFAGFDGAGDGVNNTVVSTSFVNVNAASGTFYQDAFGGLTPPNDLFFPAFPALQFDTYGTIGAAVLADGGSISTEPGTSESATNLSGGWFTADPPSNIGAATAMAGGGFGTLLFQITVLNGSIAPGATLDNFFQGSFSIFAVDPNNPAVPAEFVVNLPVPTPGSLALFGIAGLAATRRRRG